MSYKLRLLKFQTKFFPITNTYDTYVKFHKLIIIIIKENKLIVNRY